MVQARNQNQDCAMCCNPSPTEVYKHLPGFVKLLCSLDTKMKSLATKTNVSQVTSTSTAVTVNAQSGVITTFAQTLASGASISFTVNDNKVLSNSAIILTLDDNGSTGIPVVRINSVATGSFVVKITNISTTAALNAALKIHYLVA